VAILSEPYKDKHEGVWQRSSDGRAAIWSCGKPPGHLSQRASRTGYTRTFYSCYIAPSVHISEFRTIMQEIADDARGRSPILIAGDFNARSTKWGSASTTQRGTILLEAVASLNVCLLNEGNRPTFSKSGRESTIDLTFASPGLARNCVWRVSDIYTHSDHALIITEHANTCARNIADRVKEACDASMEKAKKGGNGRRPVPWWNEEIGCARRDCLAARRRCQRSRGRGNQKLRETTYRAKRKVLNSALLSSGSKSGCWWWWWVV